MHSDAKTVEEYLASLPEDRKKAITELRELILKALPKGYEEAMNWGMITYQVPLSVYPDTYNKQPLMYASLSSQKNHMAVYLIAIYLTEESRQRFEDEYKATGKRYDVGKSCVRFKKIEDLPLSLIAKAVSSIELDDFVAKFKKIQSERKIKKRVK